MEPGRLSFLYRRDVAAFEAEAEKRVFVSFCSQCTVHMLRLFTRDQLQSGFCSQQRSEIDEAIISFRVTALRGSVHWPAELSILLPPAVADVAVGFHKIPRIAARLGLELARSARSMGGPPSIEQRSDQGSHTGSIRPASTW